ncbi:MAG: T9SS type A sorting domain-containing protein [Bacteroidota bacterium]
MKKALTALSTVVGLAAIGMTYLHSQQQPTVETITETNQEKRKHLEEAKGYDEPGMFLKLHAYLLTEKGQSQPAYKAGYVVHELEEALQLAAKRPFSARGESVTWVERGPGNVAGRTPGVWIDPADDTHNTWLLGSSGGGIWKTTDGGDTWRSVTDDLPNQTISDLRGTTADPMVIYAGTGKKFVGSSVPGNGVLKSTDGGETWTVLPSTLDDPRFVNVSRVAVNQANPNEITVSTFNDTNIDADNVISYLLKSTDGGATWVVEMEETSEIQQVIAHDQDFDLQYASINSQGVYRSTDGGETWQEVLGAGNIALDGSPLGRIEIGLVPGNTDFIYLAIESEASVLLFSADQGETWFRVQGNTAATQSLGDWLGSQGWYDNTIVGHPYNDSTVLVGGVSTILRITLDEMTDTNEFTAEVEVLSDGYGDFVDGPGSKGVHVDHHNLVIVPISEEEETYYLFNGNDGGLAVSFDEGETFIQTGDTFKEEGDEVFETMSGYNTVEFYGVDKMNGEDRYVAGAQDNGSWVSAADPTENSVWASAPSGDGFQAAWHYDNPDWILESSQFNDVYRTTDGGETWQSANIPGNGPFVTEIENSKQDADLVFVATSSGVARSIDFGATWEVLTMPNSWQYSGFTTPIAISLVNPEVVWSGASMDDASRVSLSQDGGSTWVETSGYDLAERGAITNITTHPTDEAVAYVMFSQANGPKILKTEDYGDTWEDITGYTTNEETSATGFPNVPAYSMVVMPYNEDIIWAGTAIGIVESLDGGDTWNLKTDHNLPAVAVWDMRIVNEQVVIATHGRGIWSATLAELDGYEPVEVLLSPKFSMASVQFGTTISGLAQLRSPYDSTDITFSVGEETLSFRVAEDNGKDQSEDLSYDLSSLLNGSFTTTSVEVSVQSWIDNQSFTGSFQVDMISIKDPVSAFSDSLDGNPDLNYYRQGFETDSQPAVDGNALHSAHPYSPNSMSQVMLGVPLVLASGASTLEYSDIALVEPGDDFDELYYDFVAVEAAKYPFVDGQPAWYRMTRYDARQHADWLSLYDDDTDPTAQDFKTQSIDLLDNTVFASGDTVVVRFALYSDPELEGYGWVIDNIRFNREDEVLSVNHAEAFDFSVYPNPSRGEVINVSYEVEGKANVRVELFDQMGRSVKTLLQESQAPGVYQKQFATSGLKPGVYYCQLQIGQDKATHKWVINR